MIIGIDEVGRGCWAGPLVAAAVLISDDFTQSALGDWKLGDSKKLTKKQRAITAKELAKHSSVGIGWVSAQQIDKIGLTEANRQAMILAIKQLEYQKASKIVIDGTINYLQSYICDEGSCSASSPCRLCQKIEVVIGADALVPAVSAASVIAKVARDDFMVEQAVIYPEYGFEKHVGYGTKLHTANLEKFGVCDLHRRSYKPIRRLIENRA